MPNRHTDDELLSIGAVADRTGIAPSALRFYEREGLVASTRTDGAQRRYDRDVLRRLAFIRVAQTVGLGLPEIRDALGDAAQRAHAQQGRLGPHRPRLATTARRADRRPRPAARPAHRVHRLRLSVVARLRALQPRGPRRAPRQRPAVPPRRPPRRRPLHTLRRPDVRRPRATNGPRLRLAHRERSASAARHSAPVNVGCSPHGRPHPPHLRRARRDDHERQPRRAQRLRRRHGRGALRRVRRAPRPARRAGDHLARRGQVVLVGPRRRLDRQPQGRADPPRAHAARAIAASSRSGRSTRRSSSPTRAGRWAARSSARCCATSGSRPRALASACPS